MPNRHKLARFIGICRQMRWDGRMDYWVYGIDEKPRYDMHPKSREIRPGIWLWYSRHDDTHQQIIIDMDVVSGSAN